MNKYYCVSCKKEVKLKMFGDYSSSGLWCSECGVNFAGIEYELPSYIKNYLNMWCLMWEVLDADKKYRTEYCRKLLNNTGEQLCAMINEYFECEYLEENFQHCFDK